MHKAHAWLQRQRTATIEPNQHLFCTFLHFCFGCVGSRLDQIRLCCRTCCFERPTRRLCCCGPALLALQHAQMFAPPLQPPLHDFLCQPHIQISMRTLEHNTAILSPFASPFKGLTRPSQKAHGQSKHNNTLVGLSLPLLALLQASEVGSNNNNDASQPSGSH